jgi:hypothetical protein
LKPGLYRRAFYLNGVPFSFGKCVFPCGNQAVCFFAFYNDSLHKMK